MAQPPCTPDFDLANFFLFLKLQTPMKAKRFAMIDTGKCVSEVAEYKCVISEGNYFEGNKIVIVKSINTF